MRPLILVVTLLAACGDNIHPATPDGARADASGDAVQATGPCLERPIDLARPPSGALPCDLLPPGFVVAP